MGSFNYSDLQHGINKSFDNGYEIGFKDGYFEALNFIKKTVEKHEFDLKEMEESKNTNIHIWIDN